MKIEIKIEKRLLTYNKSVKEIQDKINSTKCIGTIDNLAIDKAELYHRISELEWVLNVATESEVSKCECKGVIKLLNLIVGMENCRKCDGKL